MGYQGLAFGRTLSGNRGDGDVLDMRSGKMVNILNPSDLFVVAETMEDALIKTVRLCMRPNDTTEGRRRKLFNSLPDDIVDYIRVFEDIPAKYKEALRHVLEKRGWSPSFIPEPTILTP